MTDRMRGFTLIELMIAMALTVMIGAVSYRFLDGAISASEQGSTMMDHLNSVERVWSLITADLEHIAARPLPTPAIGPDPLQNAFGAQGQRPALLAEFGPGFSLAQMSGREGAMLWFARHGWINPLQQRRANLQRVMYRIDDGTLRREYWAERNQPLDEPPTGSLPLLDNVQNVRLRYLPAGTAPIEGQWLLTWPPENRSADEQVSLSGLRPGLLPVAIEISFTTDYLGDVRRVLVLPGG